MTLRSFAAILAVCAAALPAGAADDENPYKNTKVGDYAKYAVKGKLGFLPLDGVVTQTVIDKTDKELTLKIVLTAGGTDTAFPDRKIDLTKPLDPTKGFALRDFGDAKLEKLKEGKEKAKVGKQEYDAEWSTFKIKVMNKGVESEGDVKVWMAKDVPMGLVKVNLAITVERNAVQLVAELIEFGSKK